MTSQTVTLSDRRTLVAREGAGTVCHLVCSRCVRSEVWRPGSPMLCGAPDEVGAFCAAFCRQPVCSGCAQRSREHFRTMHRMWWILSWRRWRR